MREWVIVGAGVSGLAAAMELRDREPLVLEKSRGFGGRAATREVGGIRVDHGANYFTLDDPQSRKLVLEDLPGEPPESFDGEIRVFDAGGRIRRGDPVKGRRPKWSYRQGITGLGNALAAAAGVEIRHQTQVGEVSRGDGGWRISGADGTEMLRARNLIVSVPPPQAAGWIELDALRPVLSACDYHRQFSVMLVFDQKLEAVDDFYAALNEDRHHQIAWFSFENHKPGRVPAGRTAVVVQMSPAWSAENFESARARVARSAIDGLAGLLGGRLPEPLAWDVQRWKFAHPREALDHPAREAAAAEGLHFCGDGCLGKGRVEGALLSGVELGRRLAAG